jgi:uncharacterized linocin/CFP29 family protein
MDPALVNLGWTEDQWHRVCSTVTEEAQKSRVAAQALPCVGPEDRSVLAVPRLGLRPPAPAGAGPVGLASDILAIDSDPELYLTRISVNIEIRSHEMTDPSLSAALVMFRRAANIIAHVEDSLVFYGRRNRSLNPPASDLNDPPTGLPNVFSFTQDSHTVDGILRWRVGPTYPDGSPSNLPRNRAWPPPPVRARFRAGQQARGGSLGDGVVNAIVAALNTIEDQGYNGPFACVLSSDLFEALCTPAPSLVLPRDRVLPFLQGPLLRSSALDSHDGVVISLAGAPVELVIASDLHVRFLQQTTSARSVFRVSERVAVRIKDSNAIQQIRR